MSEERAQAAAQGWGGDRYTLLRDDEGRLLIAIRFSWDTVEDADEFFQSYLDLVVEKSQGQWKLARTNENMRLWIGDDISVHLALAASGTLLVIGPDLATVETILKEISNSTAEE